MKNSSRDLEAKRRTMLHEHLRARNVTDPRVLAAMASVPREMFLPASLRNEAYEDRALPIDEGQTMSQPYTVAYMCQELLLEGNEIVLEIGTGSGYAAAVLSRLCQHVHTIERIAGLASDAAKKLERLQYENVTVHTGDGTNGLPDFAPYDAIVCTAGGETLPTPYRQQLSEGGRILIPLGTSQQGQTMCRFTKRNGQLMEEDLGRFAFVPLIGQHGWTT